LLHLMQLISVVVLKVVQVGVGRGWSSIVPSLFPVVPLCLPMR
jgi:hypothetical protein